MELARSLSVLLCALVLPVAAIAETEEARRTQCLGWMYSGYPSGLEETACTAQFSLPSPFLFKCIRGQKTGYDTDLQKAACSDFLARASDEAAESYVRRN